MNGLTSDAGEAVSDTVRGCAFDEPEHAAATIATATVTAVDAIRPPRLACAERERVIGGLLGCRRSAAGVDHDTVAATPGAA